MPRTQTRNMYDLVVSVVSILVFLGPASSAWVGRFPGTGRTRFRLRKPGANETRADGDDGISTVAGTDQAMTGTERGRTAKLAESAGSVSSVGFFHNIIIPLLSTEKRRKTWKMKISGRHR
jgi:hypothetical protein